MPDDPLPPCPGTPNCERESRSFPELPPEALFEKAQDALGAMGPARLTIRDGSERRVEAVFRVALVFKDDVAVAVTPPGGSGNAANGGAGSNAASGGANGGAVLHIRSASRVGKGDLGVNRRRVARFFRTLERHLY